MRQQRTTGLPTAIATLVAATAGVALVAQAQQAPGAPATRAVDLEEVVVTARKREERLQDVPIAIASFDEAQLQRQQVQGLADIARLTSGFSFESYASGALQTPVIRGQSQNFLTNPVQNVATFVDGIYLQRGYMIDVGLVDMERIEVLKGPQSALYGQNSFAGAIAYVTKKPTQEFDASATLTIGIDERTDARFGIGGPIIDDRLAVRVGAGLSKFDGSWENNHPLSDANVSPGTDGNVGGFDNWAANVAVLFTPTDRLTIDGTYYRSEIDAELPAQYSIYGQRAIGVLRLSNVNDFNCSPTTQFGVVGNNLFCGRLPDRPEDIPGAGVNRSALEPVVDPRSFGQKGENELIRASARYEFSDAWSALYQYGQVESRMTSGRQSVRDAITGMPAGAIFGLGTGAIIFDAQPNGELQADSHELRLEYSAGGPWSALAGAYFYSSVDYYVARNYRPLALQTTPLPELALALNGNFTILDTDSSALFASVEYERGAFTYTIEARYNEERAKRFTAPDPANGGPQFRDQLPVIPATPDLPEAKFDLTTPRFTVRYRRSNDSIVYGTLARGAKAGGFNRLTILPEDQTYDPEYNWTFEVGTKNTLLDGKLQLNAAAFYVDWSDLQITGREVNAPVTAPAIIQNLGGARIVGFELDGLYRPIDPLTFNWALSYADSAIDDGVIYLEAVLTNWCDNVICPANGDIGGNTLPRAPKAKVAVGGQWEQALTSALNYYVRTDVTYQSKQYAELLNVGWIGDRTLVDASVGLEAENWGVQLWVKNLLDKEYAGSSLFGGSFQYGVVFGDRRTAGITANYKF